MIKDNEDRTRQPFSFGLQRREWANVPIDDHGYYTAVEMEAMSDDELTAKVTRAVFCRYSGWRNFEGRWRRFLGLDSTSGRRVLDFGCGIGIEALQFAQAGNEVVLADINEGTVRQAARVLGLFGCEPVEMIVASGRYPFFLPSGLIDVFYANGVLHHTPRAEAILRRAVEMLAPGGEIRLMLYTDVAWGLASEHPVPLGDPRRSSGFMDFVRRYDPVGYYAEPYSPEKLERMVGDVLRVWLWESVSENGEYAAAVLRPR